MKKITIFTLLWTSLSLLQAQYYYYYGNSSTYSYTRQYTSNVNTNTSVDNAVNQAFGVLNSAIEDKKKKEAALARAEQLKKRVQDIRDYYTSLKIYPEKVMDGWHEIVLLGGESFIADAKVQVKNNKITDLVWDDWIPEQLAFSGPIMDCKSAIKIKGGTGPFEGLLDVYFMNFIADKTQAAKEPLKPGKVTVWTNNKDFKKYYIKFEEELVGGFTRMHNFDAAPSCEDINEIIIIYKPGIYTVQMGGKGYYNRSEGTYQLSNVLQETKVEIKPDGCSILQMNDPKKMNK